MTIAPKESGWTITEQELHLQIGIQMAGNLMEVIVYLRRPAQAFQIYYENSGIANVAKKGILFVH